MNNAHEDKDQGHGHSKDTKIVVNGRQKVVTTKEVSFAQIVAFAFDTPSTGENVYFSITYRRGQGNKPEGTLVEGETVPVKEGMIFNVTQTNRS